MGSETWRDEAQSLDQKRNVFVEKYRMPVYTDLKRPDEIEYAMETQLLGAPKENYAGMTDLKKPVSQIAQEAAAKVPWHRIRGAAGEAAPSALGMPSWMHDNQFIRSIKANLAEMTRQVGAQALTQGNMIDSMLGNKERFEKFAKLQQELNEPVRFEGQYMGDAPNPLETVRKDVQGVKDLLSGNVSVPQFGISEEDFKRKQALWEKNQKRIDEFNERVKIITDDFLQRAGVARTEEDGWLYDAGSIGSSLLSCFALTVLFRNPTVLAGLYGASEAQGVYEDAVAAGIEPAKAYGLGSIAGGANALLEEIGGEYVLQMVNAKGLITKGVAKALAKSGKHSAAMTAALGAMRGGTVEGIEEALQSIATDVIENMGGVQQKDLLPILKDALKAGVMGSIGGMFGSGPAAYGNYIKYQRHIQTSLEKIGVPAEQAEVLAREVANEATSEELSGRVLDAIESETDSPFTADERDAQAFGSVFTQEQNREIDHTAWQIGDKVEQQSLQAGMQPELAKANGAVAQTLVNNIYRITQLTPKEFEAYKIEVINENRQEPPVQQPQQPKIDLDQYTDIDDLLRTLPTTEQRRELIDKVSGDARVQALVDKATAFREEMSNKVPKDKTLNQYMADGATKEEYNAWKKLAQDYSDAELTVAKEILRREMPQQYAQGAADKYQSSENVYDNFVKVHSAAGLIEAAPKDWKGKTIEDAKNALRFGDRKSLHIKTPVEQVVLQHEHLHHLIVENNPERKLQIFRIMRTLKKPNLIVRSGVYNYYLKLYSESQNRIRPHLQVVKVKNDGSFYVTNYQPGKNQVKRTIKEGHIVYDASNMRDAASTKDQGTVYNPQDPQATSVFNSIPNQDPNVKTQTFSQDIYDQNGEADTTSPAFKRWFGDSKVVDENGQPLVVYHGTQNDFDAFAGGAFFTDDYMNADGYAGGEQIYEVYLKMENPLIIDAKGAKWDELNTPYGNSTREIVGNPQVKGYDGVIFKNINDSFAEEEDMEGSETVYYVFEPTQIKSVYNKGTFDGNDVNIYNQPLIDGLDIKQQVNVVDLTQTPVKDKKSLLTFVNSLIGKKEKAADGAILQFVKKVRRNGKKTQKTAQHIVYSSFDKNRNIHDKAVGNILSLIKNSVLVEESKAKADKKDYDKAYRFYVPVKTQDGVFAVRLVALRNKNNQSLQIKGDIYDVIVEDEPIPNHQLNDSARDRLTISIEEMQQNVKDAKGNPYISAREKEPILRPQLNDTGEDRLTISIEEMLQNVKDAEGNPYIHVRNSAAAQLSTLQTGVSTSGIDSSSFAKRVSNAHSTNPGTLSIKTKEQIVKGGVEKYNQNGGGLRGQVRIDNNAREAIIRIFEGNYDPSTVVHELAHVYLSMLHNASKVSEAPEFVELMRDLHQWLGEPTERGYSVEQQEKFARAFEAYLAEGQAPNAKLQSVFEKFAQWLAEVYDSIKDYFELTPEVKSLFDRLITVSEPVKKSRYVGNTQRAKEILQAIKTGYKNEDSLELADMKALLKTASTRRPGKPKTHLLKDLKRYGAEYDNAGYIDKEAFANAGIKDKKGGVDDRPDVWLQSKGYMEFDESNEDTLQQAYDMIDRALGGEEVYRLEDQERAEQIAAYDENLKTLQEVFPNLLEVADTERAIAQLEEKGYRVVSKQDLEMLEKKMAQLDKMQNPSMIKMRAALEKIVNGSEEETIPGLRPDMAQYGGTADVSIIFGNAKKGLKHIALRHGAEIIPQVLETVADGEIEKYVPAKKTVHLRKGNITAVLSLDENGAQKTWLLTGWDETDNKKRTDANGQVSTDSAATQTSPTFSRQDLGAVLKIERSIVDTSAKSSIPASAATNSLTNQDPFVKGARQIKEEVLREIDKRSLENKAEIKGFLEKAQTPEQIREAVGDVLQYVERAYAKTEEGKQEHSKLEIPHTDYGALKVKILKDLNRINTEQAGKLKEARETVQRLNRIQHRNIALNSEEDAALKKAYQTIRSTLDKPYQKAVAAALQGIAHLPPSDKGKFIRTFIASSYVDQIPSHVDDILRRAKEIEEKNYKKYMEGKIKDLLEMKLFSKNGTLRTANLDQESTAAMLELRRAALLTEDEATNELAARHDKYTDKLPSPVDKIINGLLSIRSTGMEDAPMEVYKAVYDGIAQIRKAGRSAVALQKMIRDFRTERDIQEVEDAVSKNKQAGAAKKVYARYIANWESILDLVTSKDLKEKYSMLSAEADAQVYFHKRKTAIMDQVKKFYGITSNWDLQKKINDLLTENITVTNYSHVDRNPDPAAIRKGGKPFEETLTKMQVLNLYIWSKNPTLNSRLETSYGEAQLKALFKAMLDAQDRRVGDLLQREAENTYGLINEVFIRERGYALPRVWNYFPSVTERVESDIDFLAAAATMAKNPSFIKNRVDSRLIQMKPGNPFSLLFRHIERAADYHYKAEKFNQIRRVFKNGRVKQVVTERFGEDIYDQMIKMIDQMSVQQAKVRYDIDKIGDKLTNNFVKSAIGLRPAITIKQLISSINYSENMPAHSWTAGFIKAVLHPKETIAFMTSGDPYIKTRFESGGMNEAVSHIMASAQAAGKRGRIRAFLDAVTTINTRLGDVGAIVFGGRPYVEYLINEKGMTKEAAFEEFRKSTLRSQQAGSKSSLSAYQAMDMNFLTRALFAFKNTPAQYARKIADAMIEYQRGEITAVQLGKNVAIYGLLNAWLYEMLTSLGILRYLLGDPDDALEDLADEFLFGPFTQMAGALPLLDTAVNTAEDFIKSKVKDEDFHFKQQNLPIVGDLVNLGNRALKDDMELEEILDLLAEAGQYGTGLPLRYIKTVPYAAADVAQGQGLRGFLELLGYTRNRARKVTDSED